MNTILPFWKTKTLEEMSILEWESLCDGCGLCCLHKIEDEDSGIIYETGVACRLLDKETCRCKDYVHRKSVVQNCIVLDITMVKEACWLPKTCAYRLIYEGKDLQWWHPLVSGSIQTVHEAQSSACKKIEIYEDELLSESDYVNYLTGPLYEGQ
ncbi:YcgN family cysteine cluster protein [Bartonella ancashensis]|uniref:UPF0260 protein PU02_0792 n=1 Tax=Bartonella ancashensis TaxID=1318743 RepID=A0A0M4LIR0_9HYPH|nr:YcgN family cysteine cluster protein [Bartonella ancashensis]ALE03606.1 hypothetical protein PU02_0792 [Bartonella ancashensis]